MGLIPWRTLIYLLVLDRDRFITVYICFAFPGNFSFIPITNQFLWEFHIFDFFVKVAKFEFGPNLEVDFWKIEFSEESPIFLEVHQKVYQDQPKLFPELLESEKIFHLKYQESAKIGGSLKIFQNLGPCNSRMGLF